MSMNAPVIWLGQTPQIIPEKRPWDQDGVSVDLDARSQGNLIWKRALIAHCQSDSPCPILNPVLPSQWIASAATQGKPILHYRQVADGR